LTNWALFVYNKSSLTLTSIQNIANKIQNSLMNQIFQGENWYRQPATLYQRPLLSIFPIHCFNTL